MTNMILDGYHTQILNVDNYLAEAGKAAAKAKSLGYKYAGWGKWKKGDMIVAKSVKDKLVPYQGGKVGTKGASDKPKIKPIKQYKNAPSTIDLGVVKAKFAKLTFGQQYPLVQKLSALGMQTAPYRATRAGITPDLIKLFSTNLKDIKELDKALWMGGQGFSNYKEERKSMRLAFIKWAHAIASKKGMSKASPAAAIIAPIEKKKYKATKEKIDNTSDDIMAHKADELAHIHGSNPGGFYVGADGQTRYVKFYPKPQQATNEHAANAIYNALGIGAPKSRVFKKGAKTGYASDMIEGKAADVGDAKVAEEFVQGMAADLLLVNYDAVGLENDNIHQDSDGKIYRIDNGGSLLFRAQGGIKPIEQLKDVNSMLNGVFDDDVNRTYARMIQVALHIDSYDHESPTALQVIFVQRYGKQFVKAVSNINKLQKKHGGWVNYLKKTAPQMDAKTRTAVAKVLKMRSKQLVEMAKNIQKHKAFVDPQVAHQQAIKKLGSKNPLIKKEFVKGEQIKVDSDYEDGHKRFRKMAPEYKESANHHELKAAKKQSEWRVKWLKPADYVKIAKIQSDWQSSAQREEDPKKRKARNHYLNTALLGKDGKHPCVTKVTGPIYRGMGIKKKELNDVLKRLAIGKIGYLPPSGFTTNFDTAQSFASENGDRVPVMIRIRPTKSGMIVGLHCNEAHEAAAKLVAPLIDKGETGKSGEITADSHSLNTLSPEKKKQFERFSSVPIKSIMKAAEKRKNELQDQIDDGEKNGTYGYEYMKGLYRRRDNINFLTRDYNLNEPMGFYELPEFLDGMTELENDELITVPQHTAKVKKGAPAKKNNPKMELLQAAQEHKIVDQLEHPSNAYKNEHEIIRPSFGAVKPISVTKIIDPETGEFSFFIDCEEAGIVRRPKYIGEAVRFHNMDISDIEDDPEVERVLIKYFNTSVGFGRENIPDKKKPKDKDSETK